MRIAKKTHYGIQFLVYLAHHPGEWHSLSKLAAQLAIPLSFLKHIAAALKRAHIVESQGGMHGGYRLKKTPEEISLGKIMRILGEDVRLVPCRARQCSHKTCVTGFFWEKVTDNITQAFDQTTLSTIIAGSTLPKKAE